MPASADNLPAGIVTFLFTDIEGSTKLWEKYPEAMSVALARHDRLLQNAIEDAGGVVFKTVGDAFCAAFSSVQSALEATLSAQRVLEKQEPIVIHDADGEAAARIRVRMALHTGTAEIRGRDYFGATLNRVARLLSLGHGGQTLLSLAASEQAQETVLPQAASVRPLGPFKLKDLSLVEQVFQLVHADLPDAFPDLRSLDNLPNNLPHQLNSFIGREREMAEIKRRLTGEARLVTLRGPGGAGKTRLAVQAAADLLDEFNGGVWLVELAPLTDPALVPQAVAGVLGIREEPGRALAETLAGHIREKPFLLILDNCEHVVEACARIAQGLLTTCPNLRLLCTSRESLGIAGEATIPVPSLGIPEKTRGHKTPSLDELKRYESVQLFAERAVVSSPAFAVSERNAFAVAQICRRLDGIPLAIELAAARTRVLSPEQIAQRLDDRFRLLTGGSRTALPRQQTLRALVDWSYDLLQPAERTLLRRLAVFSGGWTLEAAEAICADDEIDAYDVLDLLSQLADKSLVAVEGASDDNGGGPPRRYRLLETIRQYSLEHLRETPDDLRALRQSHAAFFLRFAEEAEPGLTGPDQADWLCRLDAEQDNLRAALDWSLGDESGPEGDAAALRITGALAEYWMQRGILTEGRSLLEEALKKDDTGSSPGGRVKALIGASDIAGSQGDTARARFLCEESLRLSRESGDKHGIARSLMGLGNEAWAQGDYDEARGFLEEARMAARDTGDDRIRTRVLHLSGMTAYVCEDYDGARTHLKEALATARRIGDKAVLADCYLVLGDLACAERDFSRAVMLCEQALALVLAAEDEYRTAIARECLAFALWHRDDTHYARAAEEFRESLILSERLDDKMNVAKCLAGLGGLAQVEGQSESAARLFGAVESLCDAMDTPLSPLERTAFERDAAAARAALGDDAFATAQAAGRSLSGEDAIALALTVRPAAIAVE